VVEFDHPNLAAEKVRTGLGRRDVVTVGEPNDVERRIEPRREQRRVDPARERDREVAGRPLTPETVASTASRTAVTAVPSSVYGSGSGSVQTCRTRESVPVRETLPAGIRSASSRSFGS